MEEDVLDLDLVDSGLVGLGFVVFDFRGGIVGIRFVRVILYWKYGVAEDERIGQEERRGKNGMREWKG